MCAVATSGLGAIAIIRVSGPDTFLVVRQIFYPADVKLKIESAQPYTIHYGTIRSGNLIIDEVLVSLFRAPHSYTGEDVIEISCHGSPYIQKTILELLINHGAIPAKPGEFTRRAFLNGKMDLSQAEAVADLVAAESEASHAVAMQQMRGGFSEKIKELRKRLLHFISLIELELDFSEEDVEFADRKQLSSLIDEIYALVENLRDSFQLGNIIKNGVPVAIVGRPNVGKSTLLNAILNEDRAIVSDYEGTTRDAIEDTISIGGVIFRFIDTAGIRETAEPIEKLGIRRTYQKIGQASIILLLAEAEDDMELVRGSMEVIRQQITVCSRQSSFEKVSEDSAGKPRSPGLETGKQLVLVINKSDKADKSTKEKLINGLSLLEKEHVIAISAKMNENIHELKNLLLNIVNAGSMKHRDIIITNIRHFNALKSASESLIRVREGLGSSLPADLLSQDIRETLHYLGEITGEVTTDEILENIFRNFCIGK
ncbi:MAG TPA: tRNA uridine-5-carboxymethylaminomethyl(34) synthesis GTPase MnmE [Bacteroidaceae bacterium]|nr:tRNA uridine-5-carboxymethylaminomethyl(34) synthesis GTPase MnmE [Bacteroidaceae bacterium]